MSAASIRSPASPGGDGPATRRSPDALQTPMAPPPAGGVGPASPDPLAAIPSPAASEAPSPPDIAARVIAVVSEALDRRPEEIFLHSSLIDDLGAESIDFMDIVFRLEDELGIQIPDDDLWRGAFGPGQLTPEAIAAGVATLRERLPQFRWDRFPEGVAQQDLPRLATVSTIVTYLERQLPERQASERSEEQVQASQVPQDPVPNGQPG